MIDSSSAVSVSGTELANDDDVGYWEATTSFGVGIIVYCSDGFDVIYQKWSAAKGELNI